MHRSAGYFPQEDDPISLTREEEM